VTTKARRVTRRSDPNTIRRYLMTPRIRRAIRNRALSTARVHMSARLILTYNNNKIMVELSNYITPDLEKRIRIWNLNKFLDNHKILYPRPQKISTIISLSVLFSIWVDTIFS
jgi:hypothetical protein